MEWFSGTGNGGQHRNRHPNSCRLIHIPTGIIEARQGRERISNLRDAKEAIIKTLDERSNSEKYSAIAKDRKNQVGSGMRSDKNFTLRFQDDTVVNHEKGKSMSAKKFMKGYMDQVW